MWIRSCITTLQSPHSPFFIYFELIFFFFELILSVYHTLTIAHFRNIMVKECQILFTKTQLNIRCDQPNSFVEYRNISGNMLLSGTSTMKRALTFSGELTKESHHHLFMELEDLPVNVPRAEKTAMYYLSHLS